MEPTAASEFLDGAVKIIELPTKRRVKIRRLGMDDLLDVPEAWPMLGIILEEAVEKSEKRKLLEHARDSAKVQTAMITRGVIEPQIYDHNLSAETTNGAIPLYVLTTLDRIAIVNELALFSTGFETNAEQEAAARQAGKFSETPAAPAGDAGGEEIREDTKRIIEDA